MKNKRMLYFLVPLVLVIWGGIIFKIMHHLDNTNHDLSDVGSHKTNHAKNLPDSFRIAANYRDPFLDSYLEPTIEDEAGDVAEPFSANTIQVPDVLPDVKYSGLISNQNNKQKVGLFRLKKKNYLVHEGDTLQDVKISKLFADSVILLFHKKKNVLKRNR